MWTPLSSTAKACRFARSKSKTQDLTLVLGAAGVLGTRSTALVLRIADGGVRFFDYCRNQIDYVNEMPGGGVVGSLLRGVGDCHEKAAVLVALALAGNLPARFCNPVVAAEKPSPEQIPFARLTDPIVASWESSSDERVRKIGAAARPRMRAYMEGIPRRHRPRSHPVVEMKISGYWIPCDPVFSDTEALGLGLPLPRLGYDPLLLSGGAAGAFALEGRRETLPDAYKPWARVLGYFLFRGIFDLVNRQFEEVSKKGQELLDELDETEHTSLNNLYLLYQGIHSHHLRPWIVHQECNSSPSCTMILT